MAFGVTVFPFMCKASVLQNNIIIHVYMYNYIFTCMYMYIHVYMFHFSILGQVLCDLFLVCNEQVDLRASIEEHVTHRYTYMYMYIHVRIISPVLMCAVLGSCDNNM